MRIAEGFRRSSTGTCVKPLNKPDEPEGVIADLLTISHSPAASRLTGVQHLPASVEEVFPFFADAWNLERITPPWLRFRILTPKPFSLMEGAILDYRLRWRGVPIRWRTCISRWNPPFEFVDEQVRGPYRLWRHRHIFEPNPRGTRMVDEVEFAGPCFPGEPWLRRSIIAPDVRRIFEFRRSVLKRWLSWRSADPAHPAIGADSG